MSRIAMSVAPWLTLTTVLAAVGCEGPASTEAPADARVAVDPGVVWLIDHDLPNPKGPDAPDEYTTKPLDEIDCLDPGDCRVREVIRARLYNTGSRPIQWNTCAQPLERWGLGSWHPVTRYPCAASGDEVPPIYPGQSRLLPVRVGGVPAGQYRVRFDLSDPGGPLPDSLGTSAPFQFEPLPHFEPFVCPTESRTELADRIAQAALDSAAAGGPTPDLREFLLIETRVPGFGGLFIENGYLTAWLVDLAMTDSLTAVVEPGYGRPLVVKQGAFAFSQLVGWTQVIRRGGGVGVLGVRSLDADEARNRVTIGISNELIRADVQCFVDGIGMPAGMARIAR